MSVKPIIFEKNQHIECVGVTEALTRTRSLVGIQHVSFTAHANRNIFSFHTYMLAAVATSTRSRAWQETATQQTLELQTTNVPLMMTTTLKKSPIAIVDMITLTPKAGVMRWKCTLVS